MRRNRNKQQGNKSEYETLRALQSIGIRMLEPVYTPYHILYKDGKVIDVKPIRKVSGDMRGIVPGSGQSVLVETKWRGDKLVYSDLKKHQHAHLRVHKKHGGLSLVAWHNEKGLYVFNYGIDAFQPGKSLTPEQAAAVCIAAFVVQR